MDRTMILDHLGHAQRHVAQGYEHMARQIKIIARLQRQGHDTAKARETLELFESMQALHLADCERLKNALRDGGMEYSSEGDLQRADGAHALSLESMNELRWYNIKIAEAAEIFRRSKEAVEGSRDILLDVVDPDAAETAGRSG